MEYNISSFLENAEPQILRRGRKYYDSDMVKNLQKSGRVFTAKVSGSEYRPYHVEITFDEDGRVESFKSDKMPDETNADLAILGERARESTLKRQEEIEKEKQEIQQPASEEAQQAAETEPSKEAAETPAAQ